MARRSSFNAARLREAKSVGAALALGLLGGLGLVRCAPAPAQAQPAPRMICLDYAEMAENLGFLGEAPAFRGLDDRGLVAEIWAGPSGSWTLVYVDTTRKACMAAAGQAGDRIAAPVEETRG